MIDEYKRLVDIKKYKRKAIYHSELYLFWTQAQQFDLDRIVESGTYHGFTANRLLRLFPECEIWTYEYKEDRYRKALKKCDPKIHVKLGTLDRSVLTDKTAVLIDGPKGMDAIAMAEEIVGSVAMVGIHDMDRYISVLKDKFEHVVHSGHPDKHVKALDKHTEHQITKYTKYYGRVLACVWGRANAG